MLWKNVNVVAVSHQNANASAVIIRSSVKNVISIPVNVIGDVTND